jgi:hypothetical protein
MKERDVEKDDKERRRIGDGILRKEEGIGELAHLEASLLHTLNVTSPVERPSLNNFKAPGSIETCVDSVLWILHRVDVESVVDVSEVHAAFTFTVEVNRMR